MSFDQRCRDLAEVFLSDEKIDAPLKAKLTDKLAQEIQDLIEGFIAHECAPNKTEDFLRGIG